MTEPEFILQPKIGEFLRALGYPYGDSTIVKLCAKGEGPPVDAYHGSRPLRKPATILTWAKSRLTKKPSAGRWTDKQSAEPQPAA
jgi:hypothetical protein